MVTDKYIEAECELAKLLGALPGISPIDGQRFPPAYPRWARDDAAAFRLMVEHSIDIKQYDGYVVGWFDGGYIGTGKIMYEGDPLAATRYATVKAVIAQLRGKTAT